MKEYVASNGSPKFGGDAETSAEPDLSQGVPAPDLMDEVEESQSDFEPVDSGDDDLPF